MQIWTSSLNTAYYTKASTSITYSSDHELTGAHEPDQQKPGTWCIYSMNLYIYPPHATGSILLSSTPHITFGCHEFCAVTDQWFKKITSLNSSFDGREWFLGWIDVVCALVHCFNIFFCYGLFRVGALEISGAVFFACCK